MRHVTSWLSAPAALVVLAGCETMAVSAFNGAASEIANRDCALERVFTRDAICLDPLEPTPPPDIANVFCFRNLAGVSCYAEPVEMEDAVRRDPDDRMPLGS